MKKYLMFSQKNKPKLCFTCLKYALFLSVLRDLEPWKSSCSKRRWLYVSRVQIQMFLSNFLNYYSRSDIQGCTGPAYNNHTLSISFLQLWFHMHVYDTNHTSLFCIFHNNIVIISYICIVFINESAWSYCIRDSVAQN